jgi:hypothetical protein
MVDRDWDTTGLRGSGSVSLYHMEYLERKSNMQTFLVNLEPF